MRTDTKLYNRILTFCRGSLYRFNATTAKYYEFAIGGKGEWQGGYTWKPESDYPHILNIETGKLLK